LLLGGRAGVGKTTVAWEVSALLQAASISHVFIDGDFMGQAHPAPSGPTVRIIRVLLTASDVTTRSRLTG
jgi:Mrp family chromosome partitioning ATPase